MQDVDDLGGGFDLRDVVNVGEDRTAEALFDSGENLEALREAGSAKRFAAGAVGLVERRLEDERNAQLGGEPDEVLRDGVGERLGFEHARPGDEEEGFGGGKRLRFFHGKR